MNMHRIPTPPSPSIDQMFAPYEDVDRYALVSLASAPRERRTPHWVHFALTDRLYYRTEERFDEPGARLVGGFEAIVSVHADSVSVRSLTQIREAVETMQASQLTMHVDPDCEDVAAAILLTVLNGVDVRSVYISSFREILRTAVNLARLNGEANRETQAEIDAFIEQILSTKIVQKRATQVLFDRRTDDIRNFPQGTGGRLRLTNVRAWQGVSAMNETDHAALVEVAPDTRPAANRTDPWRTTVTEYGFMERATVVRHSQIPMVPSPNLFSYSVGEGVLRVRPHVEAVQVASRQGRTHAVGDIMRTYPGLAFLSVGSGTLRVGQGEIPEGLLDVVVLSMCEFADPQNVATALLRTSVRTMACNRLDFRLPTSVTRLYVQNTISDDALVEESNVDTLVISGREALRIGALSEGVEVPFFRNLKTLCIDVPDAAFYLAELQYLNSTLVKCEALRSLCVYGGGRAAVVFAITIAQRVQQLEFVDVHSRSAGHYVDRVLPVLVPSRVWFFRDHTSEDVFGQAVLGATGIQSTVKLADMVVRHRFQNNIPAPAA